MVSPVLVDERERVNRVHNDQPTIGNQGEGFFQLGKVMAEIRDRRGVVDTSGIGTGGVESGTERVGEGVGGGEDEDGRRGKGK